MKVEEMISVLQDALDGKEIEVRFKDRSRSQDEWETTWLPTWDFSLYDYRAKPESPKPKYVPYETLDELQDAVITHHNAAISITSGVRYSIVSWESSYDNRPIVTMFLGRHMTMQEFLEDFTWLDGTPCGKEVEDGRG